MPSFSGNAEWADELSFNIAGNPGGYNLVGTLSFNPVVIIFDNQTTVTCQLSVNGTSTCKTLVSGQSFVLDMSTNHALAADYTFYKGKPFYVSGSAAGTGNFLISYIYRVDP